MSTAPFPIPQSPLESFRGALTDAANWAHRRGKHAVEVGKEFNDVLKKRRAINREYQVFRDLGTAIIAQARTNHAEEANSFLAHRDSLKYKIANARNEVRKELEVKGDIIRANYHAKTAGLHFWNVIEWFKAASVYGMQMGVHALKLAYVPGVQQRRNMYRRNLHDLGIQHRQAARAHRRDVQHYKDAIEQKERETKAARPSLIDATRNALDRILDHN